MYYYGNSYGYGGNGCCNPNPCGGYPQSGFGNGYAIILVLFILLIVVIGTRRFDDR